jgi:hypothetical protein
MEKDRDPRSPGQEILVFEKPPLSDEEWLKYLGLILSSDISPLRRADLADCWIEMYRRKEIPVRRNGDEAIKGTGSISAKTAW